MTDLTLKEAIAGAKTFCSEYRYEVGDELSTADALILNAAASGELIPKAMSDLDKAIADVKAMDMDGDSGWTAEEVAATGAATDQAVIAVILNAVASGELIPLADAKLAEAELRESEGNLAHALHQLDQAKAKLAATQAKLARVVEALEGITQYDPDVLDLRMQLLAALASACAALEGAEP